MKGKYMNDSLKRWLLVGVLVVVALPVLFIGKLMFFSTSAKAAVQTDQVTRGDIQSQVLSSAALQPAADITLSFGSAGSITGLDVKPGDRVKPGQTLASIDNSDLNLAVVQAE